MTPRDIFKRKLDLMDRTEKSMRRKLSQAERDLLGAVFDRILDRMTMQGGRIVRGPSNYSAIDALGPVYDKFARALTTAAARDMASAILGNATLSNQYFRATGGLAADLSRASDASLAMVRDRLGLTKDGKLKAGGYLQDITEDNTVRDRVRRELLSAVDNSEDIAGFRARLRAYLRPRDKDGETVPGPLEKQFNRYAFDTLQRADRAVNLEYASALDLPAAYWEGGLIETSRCLCRKLNNKLWTREEYEAIDKTSWAGKDGSIFLNAGGYGCRHTPRWVGWGDLLLTRRDIVRIDGKAAYREGAERQVYDPCPPARGRKAAS